MITIKWIVVIFSVALLFLILEWTRRGRLTFKYAFGWLVLCVGAIAFTIFDEFLFALSRLCGFTLMSNFVFFVVSAFFIFLSLLLTIFLCQQNNRNDLMAQKIAHLEFQIKQLLNQK